MNPITLKKGDIVFTVTDKVQLAAFVSSGFEIVTDESSVEPGEPAPPGTAKAITAKQGGS